MDGTTSFGYNVLLLFGAGAGFIGSGIGIMIGKRARPSTSRSVLHSTLLSIGMGVLLLLLSLYYGKLANPTARDRPTIMNAPKAS